uniref:Integrase catalytic domain-containing protein n=1 Tax=Trichogramma kaykai TaxID=54128 RepID=A0ABD2WBK7_9HYME
MEESLRDVSCTDTKDTCDPFISPMPRPESLIRLSVNDDDSEVMVLKRLNDLRLAQVKHFDLNFKQLSNLEDAVRVTDIVNLNLLTNGITSIFIKMNEFLKTVYMKIASLLKKTEKGDFNIESKLITNVEDASLSKDVINLNQFKDFTYKMEKVIESTEPGPRGEDHFLADDTYNYDLMEKRVKNVADPQNSFDLINYHTLHSETQKEFDSIKNKQEKFFKTIEKELRTLLDKSTPIINQLKLEAAVIDERYTHTQATSRIPPDPKSLPQLKQYMYKDGTTISLSKIMMMGVKEKLVNELHKPARRNYLRRSFDMRGIGDTWQADLVEMIPYAKVNKGYKYLLTVIDVFSKYSWAIPVKSKNAEDVTNAMSTILNNKVSPKNLQTDNGKEFYNSNFQNLMKKFKINHYSTFSNMKAAICERFNRTLKENMWKRFSLSENYKWIDIISDLVKVYNNTKHRTIKMKPKDVNRSNEKKVMIQYNSYKLTGSKIPAKFKIGDNVRVSKAKNIFEKGYTPNWTTEIFTIVKTSMTHPPTYHLKDYQDQPITGSFYEQELLIAKYPDIYLIENIIRKKGNKLFVKWLGFDSTHNSWINKNDI